MRPVVSRSPKRRSRGLIAVTLLSVVLVGWLAAPGRAIAQVPDPTDITIPDPDLLPDLEDVELPDPGEIEVPDPGGVELPDPGDVGLPDPDPGDDNPVSDPGDAEAPGGEGSEPRAHGRGDDSSSPRNQHSDRVAPAERTFVGRSFADVTAGPSDRPPPEAGADSREEPSRSGGNGIAGSLAPFAFPLVLMVAVGAFLAAQAYFDRTDPKLTLGAVDSRDHRLRFD